VGGIFRNGKLVEIGAKAEDEKISGVTGGTVESGVENLRSGLLGRDERHEAPRGWNVGRYGSRAALESEGPTQSLH
jgi:hypothetical protein